MDTPTPKHSDTPEYSESSLDAMPKTLNDRHRKLMRLLLSGKYDLTRAAEVVGMTVARASLVSNSPLFIEEMERMRQGIADGFIKIESETEHMDGGVTAKFEEEALASLNVLISLRDGATSERVKQVSALEILDRAGYAKKEKIEGRLQLDASEGLVNAINASIQQMREKKDAPA